MGIIIPHRIGIRIKMRLLKEVCNLHKHPKNTRKCFIVIKIDQELYFGNGKFEMTVKHARKMSGRQLDYRVYS